MKPWLVWLSLAVLVIPASQIVYVTDAEAQRDRRSERSERGKRGGSEEAAKPAYPNATREDREADVKQRTYGQIVKAHNLINEGELDEAKESFQKLEGNDKLTGYERAIVYQGLGQIAYEEDDNATALDYWQKAVQTDALPNHEHFQMLYQIAQVYMVEDKNEEALKAFDEWTRQSGENNPDALSLRANALYQLERYKEAVGVIDQAIAASDSPAPSLYELKMAAFYELEDYAGAAGALEQLVRQQPEEPKHQINLAQLYVELDQTDKALGILQKLRDEKRLSKPEHWRQLYQLYAYAEKNMDAVAVLEEGMQSGVLEADAKNLRALGDNYYLAEQLDKAIDAYGRAAAVSTDGQADQQRGHLLVEKERYADAKEALNTALRKGGLADEGTAWLLLGEAQFESGERPAAKSSFEKAAGFESSRSNARIWLQNY